MTADVSHNAVDHQTVRNRASEQELSYIRQSAQCVLATGPLEDRIRSILDNCLCVVGAAIGFVALSSDSNARVDEWIVCSSGAKCCFDEHSLVPMRSLMAEARRSGLVAFTDNPAYQSGSSLASSGKKEALNVLVAPLMLRRRVVGFLGVTNKTEGFTDHDVNTATVFSDLITIVLSIAKIGDVEDVPTPEKERIGKTDSVPIHTALFDAVREVVSEAVIVIDNDGLVVSMNATAQDLTGWRLREAKGRPIEAVVVLIDGGSQDQVEIPVNKTFGFSRTAGQGIDLQLISRDRRRHFIAISGVPVRQAPDIISGSVIAMRDITHQCLTEQSLRDSETELISIYHHSPMIMMLVDHHWRVRRINRYTADSVGRSSADMIGIHCGQALGCLNAPAEQEGFVVGSVCDICTVRRTIMDTLDRGHDHYLVEVSIPVSLDGEQNADFLLSTSLVHIKDTPMALVTLLDVTERNRVIAALCESEERFKILFAHAPLAYMSLDEDSRIIDVNNVWIELTGYPREAVMGRQFSQFLSPAHRDRFKRKFAELIIVGESKGIEYELFHRDGTLISIASNCVVRRDASGRFKLVHCIFRSLTGRQKATDELKKLVEAVRQASDGIVLTEADGTITYANPAFEQISGYELFEIIGRNPSMLKSGLQDDPTYDELWATLLSGKRWSRRMVNRRKDGSNYTAECTITPVRDQNGRIVNFVWITRDITTAIELQERLNQAQKMEAIGTLAGGIAHDFNNILFPLFGFTEMLKEDIPSDSPLQNHVNEILHAAMRSRELVHQILAFSRNSERKDQPVLMQTIVKEVVKLLRASIPKTIEIRQDIESTCPPVIADPTQIHQVVMNLATNSYHAMEENGGIMTISLSPCRIQANEFPDSKSEGGEYVLLTVSDTGCGIPKELLPRVLEPYFTTKGENKGTGLGLSVVHGIVKSFGGEVVIFSKPGMGTSVKIYLPAIEKKPIVQTDNSAQTIVGGTERILLVDDELPIVRMLHQILVRLGYEVDMYASSLAALQTFKEDPDAIDLIVTDMTMPDLTGAQLAVEAKRIKSSIPVILCTGFSDVINEEKSKALGIDAFIMKPVVKRDLAETVRKVLDDKRE